MAASKNEPIENAEQIIERFGGIRPMAKKIDVAVTTVQGWKKRDQIPGSRREKIYAAAVEHDVDLKGLIDDMDVASNLGSVKGKSSEVPKAVSPSSKATAANENITQAKKSGADVPRVSAADESGADRNGVADEGIDQRAQEIQTPDDTLDLTSEEAAEYEKEVEKTRTFEQQLAEAEKSGGGKGWIFLVLFLIAAAVIVALMWPKPRSVMNNDQRVSALEQRKLQIETARTPEQQAAIDAQKGGSFLGAIVPEEMNAKIGQLKDQAAAAKENINQAAEKIAEVKNDLVETAEMANAKAREISDDVLAQDAGTMNERMLKLERHAQDLTGSPAMAYLLQRIEIMNNNEDGQSTLDQAMRELSKIVSSVNAQSVAVAGSVEDSAVDAYSPMEAALEMTLYSAREQSAALGATFDNVPTDDLKAAAMLLTMTQLRSSVNRDNTSFDDDLNIMMNLVDEDNLELRAALERLSPQAKSGVLTPAGLNAEFKTLAGDAVASSLQGEDVPVSERAKARFNELFKVEKDGELITGTDTQTKIDKAQKQLESGDIESAVVTVDRLDEPARSKMAGWLKKADATISAQNISEMIGRMINTKIYGVSGLGGSVGMDAMMRDLNDIPRADAGKDGYREIPAPEAAVPMPDMNFEEGAGDDFPPQPDRPVSNIPLQTPEKSHVPVDHSSDATDL